VEADCQLDRGTDRQRPVIYSRISHTE
jgi:hypothetical protein